VVAVNGSIMSLYLWHLSVMVVVMGISIQLGGIGLHAVPASAIWWLTRPVWLVILTVLTVGVLAMVARFEKPTTDRRPAPPAWRPMVAAMAVCAGLGLLAKNGIAGADGLHGLALSLPLAGLILGGVVRSPFGRGV
jgi:hypothetical protein